jgi:hypothetical protein
LSNGENKNQENYLESELTQGRLGERDALEGPEAPATPRRLRRSPEETLCDRHLEVPISRSQRHNRHETEARGQHLTSSAMTRINTLLVRQAVV